MNRKNDLIVIEYEIGNWELPFTLVKGMVLNWNGSLIEIIEIISIELKDQVADAMLLVKLT